MFKRLIPVLVVLFALALAGAAFADTEDEIIAKYLKKAEKQHKHKVYFASVLFAYGKLPTYGDYTTFYHYANSNINPGSPLTGIWRSKQLGLNIGIMTSKNTSVRLGFDYWLKLGSAVSGDFDFGIEPLGLQQGFDLSSEIQVMGITGGVEYHIMNPPNNEGVINSINVRIGGGAGFYWAKWDIWSGASSINLATETFETNIEPLKGSAPGASVWLGADYPVGLLGLVLGADINYLYLNLDDVHSYNSIGEELYVSFSGNPDDCVTLDLSGLRGCVELKRYFRW
jgi:hypothetical protein